MNYCGSLGDKSMVGVLKILSVKDVPLTYLWVQRHVV